MGDIKSNQLKDIPFPDDFTDDDKDEYLRLLNLAKIEHADVYQKEKWVIHYAIIMYIRKEKGLEMPFTDEEFKVIVNKYENPDWKENKEVVCKGDEIPFLYDKENNPIFKDNSFFFKNDEEGKVAETKAESKVQILKQLEIK